MIKGLTAPLVCQVSSTMSTVSNSSKMKHGQSAYVGGIMSSQQSPYLPPTHKNSHCNPFHVWGEGEISSQNVKKKAKFSLGLQRLAQGSNPGKYTKQHAVYYPSSGDQGFEPWCKLGHDVFLE